MKVKFKKLDERAVTPFYSKEGDAGMDLTAISHSVNVEHGYSEYSTGISVEIPSGYVGLVFPRSSISTYSETMANCVGVIDSGYRGEIKIRMKPDSSSVVATVYQDIIKNYSFKSYENGDKIAQLVIMPVTQIELEEVSELSSTDRGEGGFGSTNTGSHSG